MILNLLETLRRNCMDHHERLHHHPALSRLSMDDIGIDYYVTALRGFYGFYKREEERYKGLEHDLRKTYPSDVIIARLRHDLETHSTAVDDIEIMPDPRPVMTLAEALGYLYLREGSNLGGKYISKSLESSLGLVPGKDNLFFWGHGQHAGKNWKNFQETLQQYEQAVDFNETAKYAAELFQKLDAWLLKAADKSA